MSHYRDGVGGAEAFAPTISATPWWLCPNEPRCAHGLLLHDIDDLDDPEPRCCAEGCACGQKR